MDRDRLAAFSDGVLAIIITVMVLELKTPSGPELAALSASLPTLAGYVLSFLYVAIYWNNHHHLFQLVERVNGTILWANIHLLFWLSLIPFATGWLGDYPRASGPAALYGFVLLMPAIAWKIAQAAIIHAQGPDSPLATVLGRDIKGKISPPLYLAGLVLAFVSPWIADGLYALVALLWCVPDRRIEALFDGR
ncbi:TMEM175 family protein [Acidiphilium sp.]|uniref:TMEM175 family protein n=1 Tax=Acidiphilium sp. TaxID=527 RepID=UPI002582AB7D|nr:TMEM175 family protein [Acidiphilium sp.]